MNMTELAEEIVEFLNTTPGETWTDLDVGPSGYVEAEFGLDPNEQFQRGKKSLWIIPWLTEYMMEESQGRTRKVNINRRPRVVMALSIPIEETDTNRLDVGSKEAIKRVINLREDIEKAIITHQWPLTLVDVEAEPPETIALNKRWFYVVTQFLFEGVTC
jgi:hypothetical protein